MRRLAYAIALFAFVALLLDTAVFCVMDYDVWWHVKAGQIMRATLDLIRTDPFAYTREGMPYLAIHEWLAQVVLSLVYDALGVNGIIFLRLFLIAATLGVLLAIDARRLWVNAALVIIASVAAMPGYMDRPQLWTFLFLAADLALAFSALRVPLGARVPSLVLVAFVGIEVLWVNVHGAAAIVGLLIFGAFVLQWWWNAWRWNAHAGIAALTVTGAAMVLALFLSPSGFGNIVYLWNLLNDRTAGLITEWTARPWLKFFGELWLTLAIASVAIAGARRHLLFTALVLGVLFFLARTAFRHEILLIFAATGIAIAQLQAWVSWQRFLDHLLVRPRTALLSVLLLFGIVGVSAHGRAYVFKQERQLYGLGARAPAERAADFLEREGIAGPMYNTYDLGGYLLFRGRKVFIDGRNVDYGFAFMDRAFRSEQDRALWAALDAEYGFTHAVVHYVPFGANLPFPVIDILAADPLWVLVHLDDATAVYLKDRPEHRGVIARTALRVVTPMLLARPDDLARVPAEKLAALEAELRRLIEADPRAMKARLLLARLYAFSGYGAEARAELEKAQAAWPRDYRPRELRGAIALREERWEEAAQAFSEALQIAGGYAEGIDYVRLAQLYARAGWPWHARYARLRGFFARRAGS